MRILAVIHQPDCGPGVFIEAIEAAGATLDVWDISAREKRPLDSRSYGAVLSLGGGMHVDQEDAHSWIREEKQLLAALLERDVPVLGVCLGAQLLAEAAGAAAFRASAPEIGWYEVRTTDHAAADPLFAPLAPGFRALEWHSYEFSLPSGAVALARSATCLQAYRVGRNAWGIQFHAEVTADDFEAWLDDYRSDPDAVAVGLDPDRLRDQTRLAIAGWNDFGRGLCHRFLETAARAGGGVARRMAG